MLDPEINIITKPFLTHCKCTVLTIFAQLKNKYRQKRRSEAKQNQQKW